MIAGARSRRACGALCAAALALSCGRRAPPPPGDGHPAAARAALAGGDDAAGPPAPADPPPQSGDLAAEIEAFTSVDRCVEQRAPLDAVLGDALEALGYETFVRDACRVLDAARARDVARCDPIDVSSLRLRCRATVAVVAAAPALCPWVAPERPELGRDAFCLAVAGREPRTCAAAQTDASRATCAATVRRDPAACGAVGSRTDRARCERDAARWRGVTAAPGPASPAPSGTLRIEPSDAGIPTEVSLTSDVAAGVVVRASRGELRFVLGSLDDGAGFIAPSPNVRPSLGVEIAASPSGTRASVERAELRLPGRAARLAAAGRPGLAVTIVHLEPARGGRVELSIDGELGGGPDAVRVRAMVATFVRDLVATGAGDLGAPGPMR